MSSLTSYFTEGTRRRQFVLAGVLALLLVGIMLAAYLVLRPRYQVLFSDLRPQDASTLIAALEKQKVPYRIDEKSSAILVPEGDTRAMRLKLMSGDLRLQGSVGFELFNNSDLGLTDFAQKVNYQRALQGELARTIMTLDDIDLARVHLTLPEASIFHRDAARPKASVALFMREGHVLAPDTVRGIQRLVAATVPELSPTDVIVVDQKGDLANPRGNDLDDPKYALKTALEHHYEQKILAQIAPLTGSSHASVSVDASLNFDQSRTTRESDLTQPVPDPESRTASLTTPLPGASGRSSIPAGLPPLPSATAADGTRTDRKLEQTVSEPGSIRRLSVGIVLDHPLAQEDLNRIHSVVAASIGLDPARGDVLSIFVGGPLAAGASSAPAALGVALPASDADPAETAGLSQADEPAQSRERSEPVATQASQESLGTTSFGGWSLRQAAAVAGVGLLLLLAAWTIWRFRKRSSAAARTLSQQQRDEYIVRLRRLLAQEGAEQ
ncbi:flagellar basal-body MS-ring/collar protein FliF [Paraburkholderia phenazinium]|uniref:Flagellar M-ring protein n=1 Tax=Paraburkholderia phenazinium TaxID=60549 RepID=A0A1G8MWR8_9BURK|nr:flagellar basal-body MS-ring/collar protein FliF [Paraburkholderia phenazinium]SDI72489.1 flagellar M-ring protein FliF [Paraburkholderia phenazinium]